jgi:hypothetical protein
MGPLRILRQGDGVNSGSLPGANARFFEPEFNRGSYACATGGLDSGVAN